MTTSQRIRRCQGFTLIELLAAAAVFALMMVFTAQMIGHTASIASQTTKQVESHGAGQGSMDSLARDIRNMVRTQGFSLIGGNDGTNDFIAFLSFSRPSSGSGTTPRFMGVCYRMNNVDQALVRLETPVLWSQRLSESYQTMMDLATDPLPSPILPYTVSDSVIRVEIVYVWKNGDVTNEIPVNNENDPTAFVFNLNEEYGFSTTSTDRAANMENLSAIVIGIVSVDQKSRDLLIASGNSLATIGQRFVATENGKRPMETWGAVNFDNIPGPAKSGIRTYQRIIPIN